MMNPLLFLSVLRARLGLFCLALGVTVMIAFVVSVLMPEAYRATASLVVDTRQEQSLSSALDVLASPRERAGYLQTQVDIITSPKVARRVIEELGLAEDPAAVEEYEAAGDHTGAIEDWLAESLLGNLDVETTQSSVVELTFVGDDPQTTAMIANAFADAYMETMLALRVEPTRQAAAWFDEQLTTLRADLELAQAEMTAFQQQRGIVSADERLDEKYSRLEELSNQLLRAQEQAIERRVQEELARRALVDGTPLDQIPLVQSDTYIQQLDTELTNSEARLEALATQYGPRHPERERLHAEIERQRQKLDAESKKLLAAAENRTAQSELRVAELDKALADQREQLLALKGDRDTLSVLMRNVDSAQGAYDTAMERYVVSQVESRASQTNVAMLSRAVPPNAPYRPNLLLNLALALVAGAMLGGGLVMLSELSDRRVRSITDLAESANLPLLGELDGWSPSKRPLLPRPGESAPSS